MKKNRFFAFVSAISLTAGILFTSCYDNIYSLIEKEVALDTSGLNGDISNIVRCGDYIFLANGLIYGKDVVNNPGRKTWKKTSMPVSGASEYNVSNRVQMLASDGRYLYALAFYYEDTYEGNYNFKREIFAAKGEDFPDLNWTRVNTDTLTAAGRNPAIKNVFDNKVDCAYANILGNVYKLKNGNIVTTPEDTSKFIGTDSSKIMNCAILNGLEYFSNYYAFVSDSTCIYYAPVYTNGSSNNFERTKTIYATNDPAAAPRAISMHASQYVLSLAITKDYLLAGTTNGLIRLCIDQFDSNYGKEVSMPGNGNSVISEHVYMVYAVDQGSPMAATDLYAASTIYSSISSSTDSYDSIGLYTRIVGEKWNRDGD